MGIHLKNIILFAWFISACRTAEIGSFTCISCDSTSFDCGIDPEHQYRCVSPSKKCFTALHQDRKILVRGCQEQEKSYTTAANQVETCSDQPNCNNKVIDIEFCHYGHYDRTGILTGRSFHNLSPRRFCPLSIEPMGCYALINTKNNAVRIGCASDIALGRDKHGENEEMFVCLGAECNKEHSFFTCLTHDSNKDVQLNWETTDAVFSVCEKNDKCFTYLHDETTVERGCLSKASENVKRECEENNLKCTLCNDNIGCNRLDAEIRIEEFTPEISEPQSNVELEVDSVENPQTNEQENSENSVDDTNAGSSVPEPSETPEVDQSPKPDEMPHQSPKPDGVETENKPGSSTGESEPKTDTNEEPNISEEPHTNDSPNTEVNENEKDETNQFTCIDCNSEDDPNCWESSSSVKTCASDSSSCFIGLFDKSAKIVRGCVSDLTQENESNANEIEKCSDVFNCNNRKIIAEQCHEFKYTKRDLIKGNQARWNYPIEDCKRSLEPSVGCYSISTMAGDIMRTGCTNSLDQEIENRKVSYCIDHFCNKNSTFFTCLAHKRNRYFVLSSRQPNVGIEVCKSDDKCYTHVIKGKSVERGCLSNASPKLRSECKENSEDCFICDNEIGCNRQAAQQALPENKPTPLEQPEKQTQEQPEKPIQEQPEKPTQEQPEKPTQEQPDKPTQEQPVENSVEEKPETKNPETDNKPEKPKCFRCHSSVDSNCWDNPSTTEACESPHNICFTGLYDGFKTLVRGCVGDDKSIIETEKRNQMEICSTSFCNNHKTIVEKCHSVKYTKEDVVNNIHRRWSFPATNCQPVLKPIGCYYMSTGNTVRSGCNANVDIGIVKRQLDESIEFCVGAECHEKRTFFSCLAHEPSDSYEIDASNTMATVDRCSKDDQCFTYVHGASSTERGCLSKASPKILSDCSAGNENCFVCDDDIGCNRLVAEKIYENIDDNEIKPDQEENKTENPEIIDETGEGGDNDIELKPDSSSEDSNIDEDTTAPDSIPEIEENNESSIDQSKEDIKEAENPSEPDVAENSMQPENNENKDPPTTDSESKEVLTPNEPKVPENSKETEIEPEAAEKETPITENTREDGSKEVETPNEPKIPENSKETEIEPETDQPNSKEENQEQSETPEKNSNEESGEDKQQETPEIAPDNKTENPEQSTGSDDESKTEEICPDAHDTDPQASDETQKPDSSEDTQPDDQSNQKGSGSTIGSGKIIPTLLVAALLRYVLSME